MEAIRAVIFLVLLASTRVDATPSRDYTPSGSCQVNPVCMYEYAVEQHFSEDEASQQNVTVTATVEVSCDSVGIHNGTSATMYCLKVKNATISGAMFSDSDKEEIRQQQSLFDQFLAGRFCFVQAESGKVVAVYHASGDNPDAVSFKKAIAAAFQANFRGTEEEEEIDPQSKHISHYSYFPDDGDGNLHMHRAVTSKDVTEYSTDIPQDEVKLAKDEDIEYRSGHLYQSSGSTTVDIRSNTPQRRRRQVDQDENPSNFTFTFSGSYTLQLLRCYKLPGRARRSPRSYDNLKESTLKADFDKRAAAMQQMEELRKTPTTGILFHLHQHPSDTSQATRLQRLLQLESQYGTLPGFSPALSDVLNYWENIRESQDEKDVEMRKIIYSLLSSEGTVVSQMTLLDALVQTTDEEERENLIMNIAFIQNAHLEVVTRLEELIAQKSTDSEPLLLAYGALASNAPRNIQYQIVQFLQVILSITQNETESTILLLQALGNTGSSYSVEILISYLDDSSLDIQLTAISSLRKLTHYRQVEEAFATVLDSDASEEHVGTIVETLVTGLENSQMMKVKVSPDPSFLTTLTSAVMQFNNSDLHQITLSYLEAVNTEKSLELAQSLEEFISHFDYAPTKRAKRGTDWDSSYYSLYDLVSPYSSRRNDVNTYPNHRAYIWGKQLGISEVNVEVGAGVFAGISYDCDHIKVFGKTRARGNLFGRSNTIGEAEILLQKNGVIARYKLYLNVRGYVLINSYRIIDLSLRCTTASRPLYTSPRYTILDFSYSVFIYVGTLDFFVQLYGQIGVSYQGELCASGSVYDPLRGSVSIQPNVVVGAEGGASVTLLLAVRAGISVGGGLTYRLEPAASFRTCAAYCNPKFRACTAVYDSWPGNYCEIYAWYQLRSVRWCSFDVWAIEIPYPCGFSWGSQHRWNALSKRWDLGSRGRRLLWGDYCGPDLQFCPLPLPPSPTTPSPPTTPPTTPSPPTTPPTTPPPTTPSPPPCPIDVYGEYEDVYYRRPCTV